jgi:hypothetical protein
MGEEGFYAIWNQGLSRMAVTLSKRKVVVEDHPCAGVAHESEVKVIVSGKLYAGKALCT